MAIASVIRVLGLVLLGLAVAHLAPIAFAMATGEDQSAAAFGLSAGAALFFGVVLTITGARAKRQIGRRAAILLAVAAWSLLSLFAAIPFAMTGIAGNTIGAILEATSGLTTTGLTMLADPSAVDRSLVLWRAILQWIGGFATLVLVATLIQHISHVSPTGWAGAGSRRVGESFRPRLRQVVRFVALSYAGVTAVCLGCLSIAGLRFFDALCYTFSAVSTGGFMPNTGGLAATSTLPVDLIVVVFMIAGAVNISLHWSAISGRPGVYWRDPEAAILLILAIVGAAVAVNLLTVVSGEGIGSNIRNGIFNVVSALTTTGLVYEENAPRHAFMVFLLAGFAVIGGASVSTAGGLKLSRALLLVRQSARELERLSHPHGVILIKIGRTSVTDAAMQGVWAFFVMFVFGLIVLAVALSAVGLDFGHALLLSISALANCGPVLVHAAGYATDLSALNDTARIMITVGMLVGRLEVFTVLMLITPMFWER